MWFGKGRDKSQDLLSKFQDKYGSVPGILDFRYNSEIDAMVVFIDNKKFLQSSLPLHFEGNIINLFDVRQELKSILKFLSKKEIKKDTNDTYIQFFQAAELYKDLLKK